LPRQRGDTHPLILDRKDGVLLTVHVQPKAAHSACVGIHGDALKIRIAAPPVGGAANEELIRFLAGELCLPTAAVHIESGGGGRRKSILVEGRTAAYVMARLLGKG
jgi:uncharacterized protein (TIGR00251 family)